METVEVIVVMFSRASNKIHFSLCLCCIRKSRSVRENRDTKTALSSVSFTLTLSFNDKSNLILKRSFNFICVTLNRGFLSRILRSLGLILHQKNRMTVNQLPFAMYNKNRKTEKRKFVCMGIKISLPLDTKHYQLENCVNKRNFGP